MVQDVLTVGVAVLEVEKHGRDYLLDPIPKTKDCSPHFQKCFPVIMGMTPLIDAAMVSKTRRAKEARFLKLSGGFVLRPPSALLKRVLGLHGVDVRELDQVVQHCLIVTPDNLYHAKIWLDRLSCWMRNILKGDTEGNLWLGSAVVKLRKQKQRQRRESEKKRNKFGNSNA